MVGSGYVSMNNLTKLPTRAAGCVHNPIDYRDQPSTPYISRIVDTCSRNDDGLLATGMVQITG